MSRGGWSKTWWRRVGSAHHSRAKRMVGRAHPTTAGVRACWKSIGLSLRFPPMDPYQQVIDTLKPCKRVLVTTHVRPDGDALGSTAALALGMKQRGIDADVLLLSHLPTKYAFIYVDSGVKHFDAEAGWPAGLALDAYDALVVVDT